MTSNAESFYHVEEENTAVIHDLNGGISQVTASITVSGKPLGADAFIKMEEIFTFDRPVDAGTAAIQRADMLDVLRDQAIQEAQKTADQIREHIAKTPRGNVSVHPVNPTVPAGTQASAPAPAFGASATVAVANGAAVPTTGGIQWGSVKSKFGEGELRFVTTASQSTEELKALTLAQMKAKGLNPEALVVWDNRTGPRGLEAGLPAGCVAAVKVSKEAQDFVPAELQTIAIARVKHNNDGSVYVWFTKEAEAALKYGALDRIKVA